MTIVSVLLVLLVILVLGSAAYWIITKFFEEPIRTPALGIVGVLLLIVLLTQLWPEAANYRVWK